jgi:seryl-tRNA synthetase
VFDYEIPEGSLREEIRQELLRMNPGITDVEFGRQIRIRSAGEINRERTKESIARLRYLYQSVGKEVIYEQHPPLPGRSDPFHSLVESGQLVMVSEGQYLIQGDLLDLIKGLDQLALEIAADVGAVEQEYPTFVPVELLRGINYFRDFPHHIIVGTSLMEDREALERFARAHDSTKAEYESLSVEGILEEVKLVAAPSVCYTCYYSLRNRQIQENMIITVKNRCSRNEPQGYGSLQRLKNFTMREIIFIGEREFVLRQRQKMLDATRQLMKSLDMAGKIQSAHDPFFTNDAAYKAVFQESFRLKYEWLAYLPFNTQHLAICSVNLHNDSFGKAFGIRSASGEVAQSACVGFGLERWAYAVLSQFGLDRRAWPEAVRRHVQG